MSWNGITYKNETHVELGLMALVASPTPEDACEFLWAEHKLQAKPRELANLAEHHPEQYEELREKVRPLRERTLAHNMLDNALYASEVTRVAMEQLREKLEQGRIPAQFLSRVARDVQDVQSKAVEKQLALEGRPGTITENRTAPEILRRLEQMGVINATSEEVDEISA